MLQMYKGRLCLKGAVCFLKKDATEKGYLKKGANNNNNQKSGSTFSN